MEREAVVSSNVAEIGYDSAAKTLEVAFSSGSVYQYFGVPDAVYSGLLSAPSIGRYLDAHVKKAGYKYRKL